MSAVPFSCFLIGGDTLLTQCAEHLLDEGHDVRGVITDAPQIEAFCRSRGITTIDPESDYASTLREQPFDYLFAITHLAIIPDEVLQLPAELAVNFHDGPLPRYAGLNAPVWALTNRERQYGVTWHVMTSGVDEGEILKQIAFDVSPEETALSLNTKCMAAALESFPELVTELAAGRASRTPQDLSERSYFGRFDRPPNAGLIDWRSSSEEIDALVRALTFGPYRNPVGLPKSCVSQGSAEPFVVTSVHVVLDDAASPSVHPGEVLETSETGVHVATGDGAVAITGARTLRGEDLSLSELAGAGVVVGARLETGDSAIALRLTDIDTERCRHEEFWRERLGRAEGSDVPFARGPREGARGPREGAPEWRRLELDAPDTFRSELGDDMAAGVLAALCVYLARVGTRDTFHLPLADEAVREAQVDVDAFYASVLPLEVALDPAWTGERVIRAMGDELSTLRRKGGYLRDLMLREPGLVERFASAQSSQLGSTLGSMSPVGVILGRTELDSEPPAGSMISVAIEPDSGRVEVIFDRHHISEDAVKGVVESLEVCLTAMASDTSAKWTELPLLAEDVRHRLIDEWNATEVEYDGKSCIHEAFERQVDRTPEAEALAFEGSTLTYRELDERANRLARFLQRRGVAPGALVGVNVSRSLDLVVATLGVMKAGGAYVPLDPDFPADRLALMIEDSRADVIITQGHLEAALPETLTTRIRIDTDWEEIAREAADRPPPEVTSDDLAYVIYTSGSTGRPKGVLVEHRNVANFFVGMDAVVEHEPPGVWLAVTSLSFDISVLELFWTLARGFKVVVFADSDWKRTAGTAGAVDARVGSRPMAFGLFMWGNDDGPGPDKYRLMLEGAKFFDRNGFDSVWTPERHFHAFGGPFPNPSVTSAAIAAVTERVAIRSGSCVSPLHHPIRVAEEWAVVDNLSGGRVGLSFASGWQPNDFVIRPESFPGQKDVMIEQIDVIRRLWRGESVEFENPVGRMVPIKTLPRPVQPELPFWVTTAGNPESYRLAGSMGANVLTHLLGQTIDEVADKIAVYRQARQEAGFDPDEGVVTLMLHTFVGDDDDEVREIVRRPMKDYLGASMKLVVGFAWSFPAFKRPGGADSTPEDLDLSTLSDEDSDAILDFAFERYFEASGLFGTPVTCAGMVGRCKTAGVDEIACLLDFGVDTDLVMQSLPRLKTVRDEANRASADAAIPHATFTPDETVEVGATTEDHSFAAEVRRHGVTHLQCTPSMLRLLLADRQSRAALGEVRHLMVGGEAFPASLAEDLDGIATGTVTNMYGPTETTIWSSTHRVEGTADTIPIGRPIANTALYVLDRFGQPLPPGSQGELYIGGDGVTRGYHDRAELTEERFVPDPFRGGGARMYRTGDLARFRPDAVVDFLGRVDDQVKIRGYRVELGEIEAALDEHGDVLTSAVLLREDEPGDQRLIAYLVPSNGDADEGALRAFLRRRLPDYMVPGRYVALPRMPLTPNGKTDRRALLATPILDRSPDVTVDVEPESALERTIAECWRTVLRIDRVGAQDNFFDVGGHSLLVVQLHRTLSEAIDHPVSLVDLYRFPTIRALSQHLQADDGSAALEESGSRAERRKAAMARRGRGARGQEG